MSTTTSAVCEWFALCDRTTDWAAWGPIGDGQLGWVPVCQRCAAHVGLQDDLRRVTGAEITVSDLDNLEQRDEWGGFGYLGTRHHTQALRPYMDAVVVAHANSKRWTLDDLFTWANSTHGRHCADTLSDGPAADIDERYEQAVRWGLFEIPRW